MGPFKVHMRTLIVPVLPKNWPTLGEMLLSQPKQSKNDYPTPKFFFWVCCTDTMYVGPLPWDNKIFLGVLMSRGVQRVSNSKAHWDELQNCVDWVPGLFEYLTITNWCSFQQHKHCFKTILKKKYQTHHINDYDDYNARLGQRWQQQAQVRHRSIRGS